MSRPDGTSRANRLESIRRDIEKATHYLPAQGPITVFVHHNTLHAFECLSFDQGIKAGGELFGCLDYLPKEKYCEYLQSGRIRAEDLEAILRQDLGGQADHPVPAFGTRSALRLAMLRFRLTNAPPAELQWAIAETDALRTFRDDVAPAVRNRLVVGTRRWLSRTVNRSEAAAGCVNWDMPPELLAGWEKRRTDSWNHGQWEAFTLHALWRVCHDIILHEQSVRHADENPKAVFRHRDCLLRATGRDSDLLVNELLIPICAAYLDQGMAEWELPGRYRGLYSAFLDTYGMTWSGPTQWLRAVAKEARRLLKQDVSPLDSIEESLDVLGIQAGEQGQFLAQSLLALRGWAGMIWQMESNAQWTRYPAPPGSLVEFIAVRLILERVAIDVVARESFGNDVSLERVGWESIARTQQRSSGEADQWAFVLFQLAQVCGCTPRTLYSLSHEEQLEIVHEIKAFTVRDQRRLFHLAFERKYRSNTLDAVIAHAGWLNASHQQMSRSRERVDETHGPTAQDPSEPAYQVVCCIDEREESFRRHLEEVDPECETLGVAGFFGVAMYYRGVSHAHFTPLCPVSITPRHYVREEPAFSAVQAERLRAEARRRLGHATHTAHRGTRSFVGGVIAGLFGSVAAVPMVARVLFPRATAQFRRLIGGIVNSPSTELRLERLADEPGPDGDHTGYTVDEMANIVEGVLRAIGLTPARMSRVVVLCGHGSSSLNNPHEAAHDCGACGGGRGGPNARAFARMANDPRVRSLLLDRGFVISADTVFVGAYHNTCDDSVQWYDLDDIPIRHRPLFDRARDRIDEARKRSAHERCRRFETTESSVSLDEALRHVESRSEDLSQTRPEYGHATNALCFVGRRSWSRGLFLDRRAFLTSYDPSTDDAQGTILEGLLQAVIPVCAGINLEYYFSYVDPTGYGCGTKLPHNITSLLGVMDGAASDLRPGLPWQMVEIHEPVRLLFVIEASPEVMRRIITNNESIARLVNGEWVQLALFDVNRGRVHTYKEGEFRPYASRGSQLPTVVSSIDWYGESGDHLGFASIAQSGTACFGSQRSSEA